MVLQKVLFCCLLASVLPCALSAALQFSSSGEDKLNQWLQSRLRREVCVLDSIEDSGELPPQQQNGETDAHPHSHSGPSRRVKRGCYLLTCSVHDLAHRINQLSERTNSAPQDKIDPHGYGRRRRRSVPQHSTAATGGQDRVKLAWLKPQRRGAPQKRT